VTSLATVSLVCSKRGLHADRILAKVYGAIAEVDHVSRVSRARSARRGSAVGVVTGTFVRPPAYVAHTRWHFTCPSCGLDLRLRVDKVQQKVDQARAAGVPRLDVSALQ
jgi:hypothetical protein